VLLLSSVQGTSPTGIVGIVTTLPFTLCVYVITTAMKIGDRKTDGISVPRICISLRVYLSLFYLPTYTAENVAIALLPFS
jgi:hypothetical protein